MGWFTKIKARKMSKSNKDKLKAALIARSEKILELKDIEHETKKANLIYKQKQVELKQAEIDNELKEYAEEAKEKVVYDGEEPESPMNDAIMEMINNAISNASNSRRSKEATGQDREIDSALEQEGRYTDA